MLASTVKFLELGKPLGLMLVAGIAGVATYLFTPLQAKVNEKLFPADATIKVFTQQRDIFEDDTFTVDVFIASNKWNPVPSGELEIDFPPDVLKVVHGNTHIDTASIDGYKKVTPEGGITFRAKNAGPATITATLFVPSTKASFLGSERLVVKPTTDRRYPTLQNYSGAWTLNLDDRTIAVELVEKDNTLSGTYKLPRSERSGFIVGMRDGNYWMYLSEPEKPLVRYKLEGESPKAAEQGLQLRGTAFRQLFTNVSQDDIKPSSQEEMKFHMVAAKE